MNLKVNKYDIFILKDILFQNENEIIKLLGLKTSIDINQIKYYIIEGLKKLELNEEIPFFDILIN